jgi:hypothetical protein
MFILCHIIDRSVNSVFVKFYKCSHGIGVAVEIELDELLISHTDLIGHRTFLDLDIEKAGDKRGCNKKRD